MAALQAASGLLITYPGAHLDSFLLEIPLGGCCREAGGICASHTGAGKEVWLEEQREMENTGLVWVLGITNRESSHSVPSLACVPHPAMAFRETCPYALTAGCRSQSPQQGWMRRRREMPCGRMAPQLFVLRALPFSCDETVRSSCPEGLFKPEGLTQCGQEFHQSPGVSQSSTALGWLQAEAGG